MSDSIEAPVNVELKPDEILVSDLCFVCQEESDVNCHGFRDGRVYTESYCDTHYAAKKRGSKEFCEEKV